MTSLETELLAALKYTVSYAAALELAAGVVGSRNTTLNRPRATIAAAQQVKTEE